MSRVLFSVATLSRLLVFLLFCVSVEAFLPCVPVRLNTRAIHGVEPAVGASLSRVGQASRPKAGLITATGVNLPASSGRDSPRERKQPWVDTPISRQALLALLVFLLGITQAPLSAAAAQPTELSQKQQVSVASTGVGSPRAAMLGPWRCSGDTNTELVKNMRDAGIIKSQRVQRALQETDRGFYSLQFPYQDRPQYIGYGATVSAPHMHAHALEIALPAMPAMHAKVLDVGCGSGFLTAAFARLGGESARVVGIDYVPELVQLSARNVNKDMPSLLSTGRVLLQTGDGWAGVPEEAPYDVIHVGAAAATVPLELVEQLKKGGRMIVPVGPESGPQVLLQVDRTTDQGPVARSFTVKNLLSVIYVPLVQDGIVGEKG